MMMFGVSILKVVANVRFQPQKLVRRVYSPNSQIGDGLRHYGYQKEKKFYNGVTIDDIHGPDATNVNGIGGESLLMQTYIVVTHWV